MRFRPFNSIAEGLLYALVIVLLIFSLINTTINNDNAQQAKSIAVQNQKLAADYQAQTIVARQTNADRQNEMKAYIQCIALLTKKYPDVNFPKLGLEETKAYLVDCAKSTDASEK